MPGASLYAIAGLKTEGIWSPAVMLGFLHVWRNGIVEAGGTASFTLDLASLDVCPFRFRLLAAQARTCASVLIGRMVAAGSETTDRETWHRLFAATGASGVFTTRLGSRLEAVARVGVAGTHLRDSYSFTPKVFHQASRLTTSASLGIGVRWP
jgi:hypothetical protein